MSWVNVCSCRNPSTYNSEYVTWWASWHPEINNLAHLWLVGFYMQPGFTCHSRPCLAAAVLKDLSATSYGGRAVWHAHWPAAACLSFSVGEVFLTGSYRKNCSKQFRYIYIYIGCLLMIGTATQYYHTDG